MQRLFFIIFILIFNMSCATKYGPQGMMGGDSEMKMAENIFRISFSGNGYTSGTSVETHLYRRAAELTLLNGFSHFEILDKDSEVFSNYSMSHSSSNSTMNVTNKHLKVAIAKMYLPNERTTNAYDAKIYIENFRDQRASNFLNSYVLLSSDRKNAPLPRDRTTASQGLEGPITYRCSFLKYASEEGLSKYESPFEMSFTHDLLKSKAVLIGNVGFEEVQVMDLGDIINFIEVTDTGIINATTIVKASKKSVHSRNMVINGRLVATQSYGNCNY